MIRKFLILILCPLLAPVLARAEPVPVVRLTVQPAAAPSPALKYRLLPQLVDRTPGNAALLYYRAYSPEWLTHRGDPEFSNKFEQWRPLTPGELPRKELAWVLTYNPLKEIDLAARREFCNWELVGRLRKDGFRMLLPDMQGFRDMANLLTLRARLEMADGHNDQAIYSLQTGFSLARDLGEGPTLIVGLIGTAVAGLMADQVETFIQSPNAPNLYWALTDLPRPLVDYRKPLQGETLAVQGTLALPKNLEDHAMSGQEAQALIARVLHVTQGLGMNPQSKIEFTALVVRDYPRAKRFLIAAGRSRELIEAMPAPQVVVLYSLVQFERLHDDLFKWFGLPYPVLQPGVARAEAALANIRASGEEGVPFASTLLPAVQQVMLAQGRLERRLAALRCVEAMRLYAASHDGSLPEKLKDITEAPIPVDPLTGKDFEYRVEGDKAILTASPLPGIEKVPHNSLRYEVTLKR